MVNFIIGLFNLLIKALGNVATFLINILPTSPFLVVESLEIPYLNNLNWILPVDLFLSILGYWVSAIAIYYLVQIVLRWVKVIQ